ncbi:MAG: DUF711 family protein, partial [Thermoplasmatota archaeon]
MDGSISRTMKIRTLTAGLMLDLGRFDDQVEEAAGCLKELRELYEAEGTEVQTLRVSTQRWETFPLESMPLGVPDFVSDLEGRARKEGIDFVSVGPATTPAAIKMIPSIIENTSSTCCSSVIADENDIRESNIEQTTDTIREISRIAINGSKGFMFAALANCPAITVADMQGVAAGAFPQQFELAEFQTAAGC